MTDQRIEEWQIKKHIVKQAEDWNNLPKGIRSNGSDDFSILEIPETDLILVRRGRKYSESKNSWDSPNGLNIALTKYIIKNWDKIYPIILDDLKQDEINALKDCQSYIDEMQKLILGKKLKNHVEKANG